MEPIMMRAVRCFHHTLYGDVAEGEIFYPLPDEVAFYWRRDLAVPVAAVSETETAA